jgi:hypothetical protein
VSGKDPKAAPEIRFDRARLDSIPGRMAPGDPAPIFTMAVKDGRIAYIQVSRPREGEYLAADEVRFTPIDGKSK